MLTSYSTIATTAAGAADGQAPYEIGSLGYPDPTEGMTLPVVPITLGGVSGHADAHGRHLQGASPNKCTRSPPRSHSPCLRAQLLEPWNWLVYS